MAYDYQRVLILELESIYEDFLLASKNITHFKNKAIRHYNIEHVSSKLGFTEREFGFLKTVLHIGYKDLKFDKWSPTWEEPFIINQVMVSEAYLGVGKRVQVYKLVNGACGPCEYRTDFFK